MVFYHMLLLNIQVSVFSSLFRGRSMRYDCPFMTSIKADVVLTLCLSVSAISERCFESLNSESPKPGVSIIVSKALWGLLNHRVVFWFVV